MKQYTVIIAAGLAAIVLVLVVFGADFLGYNDAENLAAAVGIPKDSMCFTCSSGNYDSLGITPEFRSRKEMKGE